MKYSVLILAALFSSNQASALTPQTELSFKAKEAANFCAPVDGDLNRWKTKEGPIKIPTAKLPRAQAFLEVCDVLTQAYEASDEKLVAEAMKTDATNALGNAQSAFRGCWTQCFDIAKAVIRAKSELTKDDHAKLKTQVQALVTKRKFPGGFIAKLQNDFIKTASAAKLISLPKEDLAKLEALAEKLKAIDSASYDKMIAISEKHPGELDEKAKEEISKLQVEAFKAMAPEMARVNEITARTAR